MRKEVLLCLKEVKRRLNFSSHPLTMALALRLRCWVTCIHRARALNNVNVENLLTNWEIGAFISRRLANSAWGSAAVAGLVDYIHSRDPKAKGYGRSSLYAMVAVYEAFSAAEFRSLISSVLNCK